MTATVRVATLNLGGQRGDRAARRRVLAAGFARLNADLVAFQLVAFQEAIVTSETDQARETPTCLRSPYAPASAPHPHRSPHPPLR
jgi:hypothetical protein